MNHFIIGGVEVVTDIPDLFEEEVRRYIDYCEKNSGCDLKYYSLSNLVIKDCPDGKVEVSYTMRGKFERIRRITG